jgi:hypothetical protein
LKDAVQKLMRRTLQLRRLWRLRSGCFDLLLRAGVLNEAAVILSGTPDHCTWRQALSLSKGCRRQDAASKNGEGPAPVVSIGDRP